MLTHRLLAGQEGLEPPTCGFGDRRSNQLELLAYDFLRQAILLHLFMRRMLAAPFTIFFHLDTVWGIPLIFLGCIVPLLTIQTTQCNNFTHCIHLLYLKGQDLDEPASFNHLGNHAGTDGAAALANSKTQAFVHSDGHDEFNFHFGVVPGHDHFDAFV